MIIHFVNVTGGKQVILDFSGMTVKQFELL